MVRKDDLGRKGTKVDEQLDDAAGDDEMWKRRERRERERRETYGKPWTSQTTLSVVLCQTAARERGCRMEEEEEMVGCVKQGTTSSPALPHNVRFLIHKIQNKIHRNYCSPTNDERRAVARSPSICWMLGPWPLNP